jgi:hypothetical protein
VSEFNDQEESEGAVQLRTTVFRDKHKGKDLKALVVAMHETQRRKEAVEADLKNINAEFDVLRFELIPERMDSDGVERVSYDGIGRVALTGDIRTQVAASAVPDLIQWFRKNKMGDLVKAVVMPSTLKAWVKGRIKEGKPYPDDLVKVTPITRASITKQ